MIQNSRTLLLLVTALLVGALALAGCRKDDTKTPVESGTTIQQLLPIVGEGQSPLPTPATGQSPVKP